jgi:hypothetical protein
MKLKISQMDSMDLNKEQYEKQHKQILAKSCLCIGLGTSSLKDNGTDLQRQITSICPGPNIAYFSKTSSLKNMVNHIYGKESSVKVREDRPNIFVKELSIYINFLKEKLAEQSFPVNRKEEKYYKTFVQNINNGIEYYKELFQNTKTVFQGSKSKIIEELESYGKVINEFSLPVVPKKELV